MTYLSPVAKERGRTTFWVTGAASDSGRKLHAARTNEYVMLSPGSDSGKKERRRNGSRKSVAEAVRGNGAEKDAAWRLLYAILFWPLIVLSLLPIRTFLHGQGLVYLHAFFLSAARLRRSTFDVVVRHKRWSSSTLHVGVVNMVDVPTYLGFCPASARTPTREERNGPARGDTGSTAKIVRTCR
jgi:hypothetical protein